MHDACARIVLGQEHRRRAWVAGRRDVEMRRVTSSKSNYAMRLRGYARDGRHGSLVKPHETRSAVLPLPGEAAGAWRRTSNAHERLGN
jgi:hypothetical protein